MIRYLGRRALHAVLVMWAAFTVSFLILFIVPGDPVSAMLGPEALASTTPEQLDALRAEFGTDKPVVVQYGVQLLHLVQFNLGQSFRTGQPVAQMIGDAIPSTLVLASSALVLALILGISVAVAANFTRRPWLKALLLSLPPIAVSMPTFWVGLMLLQFVSFRAGLLPAVGGEGIQGLILPAVTLAVPTSAVIAQVLARSLETTLAEPYVEVIRAKGAGRARIHFGHALRNAAIPALTVTGVLVATMFGGSVLVETVFARNGLGQTAATAVSNQDIPVVQGVVLVTAAIFVVSSLVVDLIYPLIDPRIRLNAAMS
ncbi:ABC transporter permease [Kineosporia succinea]|uniref:Peptide/nickel transport system permease protein n=1 Tax=Kineosporia succinea TaxID=84632 RepID=A0ABT9PA11_9ACTN|nr:ABC transporter permease [Kineosporia succinea]MDP9829534.1 peptide/nickel transport system permease protein [Kineosporia succinea]